MSMWCYRVGPEVLVQVGLPDMWLPSAVLGLQMSDYGAHPVRWELLLLTVPGGAGLLYVHVTTTLQWDPEHPPPPQEESLFKAHSFR